MAGCPGVSAGNQRGNNRDHGQHTGGEGESQPEEQKYTGNDQGGLLGQKAGEAGGGFRVDGNTVA